MKCQFLAAVLGLGLMVSVSEYAAGSDPAIEDKSAIAVKGEEINLDTVQLDDNKLTCKQIRAMVEKLDVLQKEAGESKGLAQKASAVGMVGAQVASTFMGFWSNVPSLIGAAGQGATVIAGDKEGRALEKGQAIKLRKAHLVQLYLKKDCK